MISALSLILILAAQAPAAGPPAVGPTNPAAAAPPTRILITPSRNPAPNFQETWDRRVGTSLEKIAKDGKKGCVPKKPGANETEEQREFYRSYNQQKTPSEVEKYLSCYPSKNYQKYLTEYRSQIETAAQEFGVDASLMKCLLLRESQWDAEMMSCTCATGLGQQVSDNIKTIGKDIENPKSDISKSWNRYMSKVGATSHSGCTGKFTRSGEEKNHASEFYKSTMSHVEKGCGAISCDVFHQDDRRCAPASIGATAAYLSKIEKLLTHAVNCGQLEPYQVNDGRIAMAVAYNAGEGTALEAFKVADDTSLMSVNLLTGANVSMNKSNEMHAHYRAIHSCMQKGNRASPSGRTPENSKCFETTIQAGPPGNGGATR